jgi:hypothetical protein
MQHLWRLQTPQALCQDRLVNLAASTAAPLGGLPGGAGPGRGGARPPAALPCGWCCVLWYRLQRPVLGALPTGWDPLRGLPWRGHRYGAPAAGQANSHRPPVDFGIRRRPPGGGGGNPLLGWGGPVGPRGCSPPLAATSPPTASAEIPPSPPSGAARTPQYPAGVGDRRGGPKRIHILGPTPPPPRPKDVYFPTLSEAGIFQPRAVVGPAPPVCAGGTPLRWTIGRSPCGWGGEPHTPPWAAPVRFAGGSEGRNRVLASPFMHW